MPIPSHISTALCLIKHKNSFTYDFIFLILSFHLCLGLFNVHRSVRSNIFAEYNQEDAMFH